MFIQVYASVYITSPPSKKLNMLHQQKNFKENDILLSAIARGTLSAQPIYVSKLNRRKLPDFPPEKIWSFEFHAQVNSVLPFSVSLVCSADELRRSHILSVPS